MPGRWLGAQVSAQVKDTAADVLIDLGLLIEGGIKAQLYPGHGLITGTLRRSYHLAGADQPFTDDDSDQSGRRPEPVRRGSILAIAVGSGLKYAMTIEDRYRQTLNALDQTRGRVGDVIRRRFGAR